MGCLMLMSDGDDAELSSKLRAILGNYQQQGFEVMYDENAEEVKELGGGGGFTSGSSQ